MLRTDNLTVPAVAEMLECKPTYVYRCIRNNKIKSLDTEPTQVTFEEVIKYVNSKLPTNWRAIHNPDYVAGL